MIHLFGSALILFDILYFHLGSEAITCYKCESHRDYRCLDPFDYRPHISVNCDFEPYVRDRNPVFCEKITELGMYRNKLDLTFQIRKIMINNYLIKFSYTFCSY